jgi:hypothetical protein
VRALTDEVMSRVNARNAPKVEAKEPAAASA